MEIEIIKNRSLRACLSDALKVYRKNFKTIFKKTWIAAVICALFLTATIYFRIPNKHLHDWGEANGLLSFAIQTVIYIGCFVASIPVFSAFFSLFTNHSSRITFKRYATIYIIAFACFLIPVEGLGYLADKVLEAFIKSDYFIKAVMQGETMANIVTIAVPVLLNLLVFIIALLISLPFINICIKYTFDDKDKLTNIWKNYTKSLHHFGISFALFLAVAIISILIISIVSLPLLILILAHINNQLGILDGDPSGAPGYFSALLLITMCITSFFIIYLEYYSVLCFTYLYGSIEAQEQDKKLITQYENN